MGVYMEALIFVFIFCLGAILASFYGVLALRLPKNESVIKPNSYCPNCKHTLKWYDLIPIVSYISTLGKCRYCHKKISLFYPLSELLLGTLFSIAYYLYGPMISYDLITILILLSLTYIIFVSDFNYFIILDSPLFGSLIALFVLKIIYYDITSALLSLLWGIILFGIMFVIKKIGDFIFKRESLGGGDIKLALVIGYVLGLKLGICALILSSFLALPYAVLRVNLSKEKEVPFGPFIIGACIIVYLFIPKFINLLSYLFI